MIEITKIKEFTAHTIWADEMYTRYSPVLWTVRTGESVEQVYDCDELEEAYQKYKSEINKLDRFKQLQSENAELYDRKNANYGDNFSEGFKEYGMTMPLIRLDDKLRRAKQLSKNTARVGDESIIDTLRDLNNYALMTIIEIECSNEKEDK